MVAVRDRLSGFAAAVEVSGQYKTSRCWNADARLASTPAMAGRACVRAHLDG